MDENEISKVIVDAALDVHKTLGGPGLLESVYQEALVWELISRGLAIEREKPVKINYKGHLLPSDFRLDLLVEGKVIIECKATAEYNSIYNAQLLTYLRLTGLKLGLVINFGQKLIKEGIHRVVNGL